MKRLIVTASVIAMLLIGTAGPAGAIIIHGASTQAALSAPGIITGADVEFDPCIVPSPLDLAGMNPCIVPEGRGAVDVSIQPCVVPNPGEFQPCIVPEGRGAVDVSMQPCIVPDPGIAPCINPALSALFDVTINPCVVPNSLLRLCSTDPR